MARGILRPSVLYHGVFMNFDNFHFSSSIRKTLSRLGYTNPTPIQQIGIPYIIEGRDLLGIAQTGTGKTAAFSLPILQKLDKKSRGNSSSVIKALIIAPTRELAEQTQRYLQKFTKPLQLKSAVAYGGISRQIQIKKLREGADILVACPGRLLDLVNERVINLQQIETLVLDEADQMFDQGFLPDIRKIISKLPKKRQNLVFSATMPQDVRKLIDDMLDNPVLAEIEAQNTVSNISHSFFKVEQSHKTALLKTLLAQKGSDSAIIFTRTRMKAKRLAEQLEKSGFTATAIQGDLSQQKRQRALDGFKKGKFRFLVATDVASRGIDIKNLPLVINFDMPENAEVYTHRTGRTGRAGASGSAYTLTTGKDIQLLRILQKQLGKVDYPIIENNRINHPPLSSTAPQEKKSIPPQQRKRGKRSSQRNQQRGIFLTN